jgi:hypothetical protein
MNGWKDIEKTRDFRRPSAEVGAQCLTELLLGRHQHVNDARQTITAGRGVRNAIGQDCGALQLK